jgi:hypothetical protein
MGYKIKGYQNQNEKDTDFYSYAFIFRFVMGVFTIMG